MGIEITIALIGLASVVVTKIAESFLSWLFSRAKQKADIELSARNELRLEIERKNEELVEARTEIRLLESRQDDIVRKYYALLEGYYTRQPPSVEPDEGFGLEIEP